MTERLTSTLSLGWRRPETAEGDVILYSGDTSKISDKDTVRLVALPPNMTLPSRSAESDAATPQALEILQFRGDVPRIRRNTLLFLAAKRDEVRNLRNDVRRYLGVGFAHQRSDQDSEFSRQSSAAGKDRCR